ncbi:hypothetical protein BCR35DRAFT_310531 [Leucosporidium creatinivorum]|uniref:F-box domain-containing protein n=1 Tax=Leucosporidium creatinivorum TaxID=106004 RepID=A0A1Y2D282_9BASI|nr:hypothetical protein BCR35DRAFT_310531 [Leucosporidium creatinivorum]
MDEASSPPLERDHLSTLPRETLASIFDLVFELNIGKQMTGAINRSLLPYTRHNQLKRVRIWSWRQLELLVDGAAELGEFIEELSLAMGPLFADVLQLPQDVEEPSPSNAELVPFLRTLKRLRNLAIKRTTRLAELILSPQVSDHSFPSLNSLELDASFSHWPNPFEPCHWTQLDALSSLQSFTLMVARDPSSIYEPEEGVIVEEVDSPNADGDGARAADSAQEGSCACEEGKKSAQPYIENLVLCGALGHPLASRILEIAPKPITLVLIYEFGTSTFASFLQQLRHPERICSLSIYNDVPDEDEEHVDDLLHPFSQLDNLTLSAGTFGPSLFTRFLRNPLPLSHLTFGPDAPVTAMQLLGLIEGSSRLSLLETLTLDMVNETCRGTRIQEDAGGVLCSSTEDGVYDDWVRTDWEPWLPREGAEQVVRAGKKAGVEVKGRVLDALRVEAEYEAEVEYARSLRS